MKKLIIMTTLVFSSVFGAGVTSHRFMSKKSLDYIRDASIKNMLQRNFGYFMGTTMLPDMGYLISQVLNKEAGWWGEELHWAKFINGLWDYTVSKCKSKGFPPSGSAECEYLWTLYFGVLSHSIGDIQWHGGYIFRFGVMESGAAVKTSQFNSAHTVADNMGDLPAVHYYGEKSLNGSIHFDWTLEMLNAFSSSMKKPSVNKNYLMLAHGLQESWYSGVKIGWPAYSYFKLKYKWGHDNYLGTLGGIDNTARRLAELIDMISWENKRLGLSRRPTLETGGDWPYNYFKIAKADDPNYKVNKSYHEPNYQLSPPGTYNCRWGLYLGGWRWFQFGEVSRCPYKATANYQNSQCERYRYWPLSCKSF